MLPQVTTLSDDESKMFLCTESRKAGTRVRCRGQTQGTAEQPQARETGKLEIELEKQRTNHTRETGEQH